MNWEAQASKQQLPTGDDRSLEPPACLWFSDEFLCTQHTENGPWFASYTIKLVTNPTCWLGEWIVHFVLSDRPYTVRVDASWCRQQVGGSTCLMWIAGQHLRRFTRFNADKSQHTTWGCRILGSRRKGERCLGGMRRIWAAFLGFGVICDVNHLVITH